MIGFNPFNPTMKISNSHLLSLYVFHTSSVACKNSQFFLLLAAGDVYNEERLQLRDRNSILMTSICPESGHKHWLDDRVVTLF